jgi:hypothetical protein
MENSPFGYRIALNYAGINEFLGISGCGKKFAVQAWRDKEIYLLRSNFPAYSFLFRKALCVG